MKNFSKKNNSQKFWDDATKEYSQSLENAYHSHRLEVIWSLIPDQLLKQGKQIVDFGCGDAVLFPKFLSAGAHIEGIDISQNMIKLAKQRLKGLGADQSIVSTGDVSSLKKYSDNSVDALMCFNVLAYMLPKEEKAFYTHAQRILKKGGFLIVTHSNELFDMFSLNQYTIDFFKDYFVPSATNQKKLLDLLNVKTAPQTNNQYLVRENPLSYKFKLQKYGFNEVKQAFINYHQAPPTLLANKDYPNTLNLPEEEEWKLMFTCSTYGSCSQKDS